MRAREFKRVRAALGLSQAELAEAIGYTRGAIARYESGDLTVPKVVILALEALQWRRKAAQTIAG